MGLGYDDVVAVHPRCVYASVSGFGNSVPTPYRDWPAFAPIVEAMSGVYETKRQGDLPPVVSPVGALGDIGAALYATIGHPRRPAGPRPDRAPRLCRRGHARLRDGHDGHRHQLLVDGGRQR